ncbi:MAG: hypothetical protein VX427_15390 [Acidobacteriota bacterium]|nr:hypothetical protein [Acidobacteriota bacterium]
MVRVTNIGIAPPGKETAGDAEHGQHGEHRRHLPFQVTPNSRHGRGRLPLVEMPHRDDYQMAARWTADTGRGFEVLPAR